VITENSVLISCGTLIADLVDELATVPTFALDLGDLSSRLLFVHEAEVQVEPILFKMVLDAIHNLAVDARILPASFDFSRPSPRHSGSAFHDPLPRSGCFASFGGRFWDRFSAWGFLSPRFGASSQSILDFWPPAHRAVFRRRSPNWEGWSREAAPYYALISGVIARNGTR
jgi:hypothetical protein